MVSVNLAKELPNVLPKCNPMASQIGYTDLILVSLCLGVSVLNRFSAFPFASLLPCDFALSRSHLPLHVRRLLPAHPLQRHCQLCSGGHRRANHCTRVISAATAEPAAMQKCQFSGFSAASHLSFQRKIVTKGNTYLIERERMVLKSLFAKRGGI